MKKVLFVSILAIAIAFAFSACGSKDKKEETPKWPAKSEIGKEIPKPDFGKLAESSSTDTSERLMLNGVDSKEAKNYYSDLKDQGFTKEISAIKNDEPKGWTNVVQNEKKKVMLTVTYMKDSRSLTILATKI